MVEAFDDVLQTSLQYKVDLRTAAYIVAIARVGTVTRMRGMYALTDGRWSGRADAPATRRTR